MSLVKGVVGFRCSHILYSTLSQKIQEGLSDVKVEVLDVAERVADVQLKVDCMSRKCQTSSSE